MTTSAESLAAAARVIEGRMGLYFPPWRHSDLVRGLSEAAVNLGYEGLSEIAERIASGGLGRSDVERLARHLTVGETYFFREPSVFTTIRNVVIPDILRSSAQVDRKAAIWCAGCCTGEEAYSLAILLAGIEGAVGRTCPILATDINPYFLATAKQGEYKGWSFRDDNSRLKDQHFVRLQDGRFRLDEQIRDLVHFEYLNLAESTYPSLLNGTVELDLIFCRNVLMYFSPDRMREAIDRLYSCLVPGGWLVVGSAEVSHHVFSRFHSMTIDGSILYRKPKTGVTTDSRLNLADAVAKVRDVTPVPASRLPRHAGVPGPRREAPKPQRVPQQAPTEASRLVGVARQAADRGALAEALSACDAAVAADRLNPVVHHLRGTILDELGRPQDAVLAFRTALYLAPDFAMAHFALGNLHLRLGHRDVARRHLGNAERLLAVVQPDSDLPGADGLTAGRLLELARTLGASAGGTGDG